MNYEHQEALQKRENEYMSLMKMKGVAYKKAETFDEFKMECALAGVHTAKIFDRFWWYYLEKNYGWILPVTMIAICFCLIPGLGGIALVAFKSASFWGPFALMILGAVLASGCWIASINTFEQDYVS